MSRCPLLPAPALEASSIDDLPAVSRGAGARPLLLASAPCTTGRAPSSRATATASPAKRAASGRPGPPGEPGPDHPGVDLPGVVGDSAPVNSGAEAIRSIHRRSPGIPTTATYAAADQPQDGVDVTLRP